MSEVETVIGDHLVHLAEAAGDQRAQRQCHRIAGGEGGRDHDGAEGEPNDDDQGAQRPSRKVAGAEPHEHAAAQPEDSNARERTEREQYEPEREASGWDAEKRFHC
ncbi:MAG TPA: hypothetical protein VND24_11805 [Steroidobacteraceae bacterium]|nr:hypothetical protein [Steroidobacteraceae bacterium]